MTNGEDVNRSGSYVIDGDEMTMYLDQVEIHMTRIKDDLLNTWNNAIIVEI
jgi:hypothetical protein